MSFSVKQVATAFRYRGFVTRGRTVTMDPMNHLTAVNISAAIFCVYLLH